MFSAAVAAQRSKDPNTQVGAVIVDVDKHIVSSGYNGFCTGVSDDDGKWGKESSLNIENKYMYVCHAEMNAIISAKGSCKGCTLYSTHFPCHSCAQLIIQSGIEKVVYGKEWGGDKDTNVVSKYLMAAVGVDVSSYIGRVGLYVEIN